MSHDALQTSVLSDTIVTDEKEHEHGHVGSKELSLE